MTTYTITAESCDNLNLHIALTGTCDEVSTYERILKKSFRRIYITNDDTGEVMSDFYKSDEWFVAEEPYWRTIGELESHMALSQCFSIGTM